MNINLTSLGLEKMLLARIHLISEAFVSTFKKANSENHKFFSCLQYLSFAQAGSITLHVA